MSARISREIRASIYRVNPSYGEIFMAAGKIYVSFPRGPGWREYGDGWLALVQHMGNHCIYMNLYDTKDSHLLFQHELYCDFMKTVHWDSGSTFLTFQSDKTVIGILFLNPDSAQGFHEQLRQAAPNKKGKSGMFSIMPTPTQSDPAIKERSSDEKEPQAGMPTTLPLTARVKRASWGPRPASDPDMEVPESQRGPVKGVPALLALANRLAARRAIAGLNLTI
jgi:hypothetical protein